MHSELVDIRQEKQRANILVFDNCGFGRINNLEMNHGIGSFTSGFRCTDGRSHVGT